MRKRDSRNSARLMTMLVTLILIMVIVIISLLAGGRVWKEQEETTGFSGQTILAGDHEEEKDTPSLEETMTEADGQVGTQDEEKAVLSHGIDVSKWQGKIDWQQVADAGVDFAMIRVGFRTTDTGEIEEDPYAAYNLQQAARAGIQLGVYFFSTAVTGKEAREEARWTADFIAGYPITYPVVYNCEGFLSPGSRMYETDIHQRTEHALAFLEEIERAGYEGMFYASKTDLTDGVSWDITRIQEERSEEASCRERV